MQRQNYSQATSTLGNTPNLNIGFLYKRKPYIGSSDWDYYKCTRARDYARKQNNATGQSPPLHETRHMR